MQPRIKPELLANKLGPEIVQWCCDEYIKQADPVSAIARAATIKFRNKLESLKMEYITYDQITTLVKWKGIPVRDRKLVGRLNSEYKDRKRGHPA